MTDIIAMSVTNDMSLDGVISRGADAIREAAYRRLVCPPGGEFYAPGYGLGLLGFIGRSLSASAIRGLIASQLSLEERIEAYTIEVSKAGDVLTIDIMAQTAEGPFTLTLPINTVTVEILPSVPYGQ